MASKILRHLAAAAGLSIWLAAAAPAYAGEPGNTGDSAVPGASGASPCAAIVAAAEERESIPRRLLTAISLAESGRYDEGQGEIVAWPWTINAEGEGRFFATKAAAIAAVKKLRARGVTSIDVGCMQVNLHHHPDAFASLDAAFDPETNAAYAAQFLKQLKDETRSWSQAVAFYHSTQREFSAPYRSKVYKLWAQVRRHDAEAKRQEVLAAYNERRREAEARRQEMLAAYSERRREAEAKHQEVLAAY
jgi:hypothetical protein